MVQSHFMLMPENLPRLCSLKIEEKCGRSKVRSMPMNSMRLHSLDFEPLSVAHFPLLFVWLNTPHVIQHWDGVQSIEEVEAKYGGKLESLDQRAFIVSKEGTPFAYIQKYRASTVGGGWWPGEPDTTVGIDQFIGSAAHLAKGLGTEVVREFSDWLLLDPHTKRIITDPKPTNIRAIRCYKRAGFTESGLVETPDGVALVMEMVG